MKVSEKCYIFGLPLLLVGCGLFVGWIADIVITELSGNSWTICKWVAAGIGAIFGFIMQIVPTEEEEDKMYQLTLEDVARYQEKENNREQSFGRNSGSSS